MSANPLQGTPRVDALEAEHEESCDPLSLIEVTYSEAVELARQLERELAEATMEGKIDGSPDDPLAQRCLDLERDLEEAQAKAIGQAHIEAQRDELVRELANEQACTKAMNEDLHKMEDRIQRLEGALRDIQSYANHAWARETATAALAIPSGSPLRCPNCNVALDGVKHPQTRCEPDKERP